MRLLVVAAWDPELERFRALGVPGSCVTRAIGVGPVDAGIGMARALAEEQPDAVVLLGTCGALGRAVIGEIVVAREARLIDPATLERRAALPYATGPIALATKPFEEEGARRVVALNPLGITIDEALAATLTAHGDIEHLEAFGVARACEAANIPCAIVLGVTNQVGERGRDEWRANHVEVSARVAELAHRALDAWFRTSTKAPSPA
jgi:nucleoside phosphorylase